MHFSLEWFLLELSWNVASYRDSVYTQFDDEGFAAGNLETWNKALIITLPLFSIGSWRYAVPQNRNLLLFWCPVWIDVPEFRYADLETMSLESRATQKTQVSQKDTGLWVGDNLCASAAKASSSLGCMRRSMASRLRRDSYPLLTAGGTYPGSVSKPGPQYRQGLVVLQPVQGRATEMMKRQKNLTHGERQSELRLSKLQKRKLKGYFASLYQYQMMESKGGRATQWCTRWNTGNAA